MVRTGKVSKKYYMSPLIHYKMVYQANILCQAKREASRPQDGKTETLPTYTHRYFEVRGPVMNYIN